MKTQMTMIEVRAIQEPLEVNTLATDDLQKWLNLRQEYGWIQGNQFHGSFDNGLICL